mmetsp:Transcript_131551/g.196048  ORF Transcript_131551/g.196048 Transcript_131551/m.196048 type:complete len:159 (-) Transcript_131551:971-1447(-)
MEVFTVIVIGSGFAGSSCASTLEKNNIDYVVLEGAEFTGGRTQTIHLQKDTHIDTGACFIHGTNGNPLIDQSIEHNVQFKSYKGELQMLTFFESDDISYRQKKAVEKDFKYLYKQAKKIFAWSMCTRKFFSVHGRWDAGNAQATSCNLANRFSTTKIF